MLHRPGGWLVDGVAAMALIYDEEDFLDEEEIPTDDYDGADLPPSVEILWPPTDWNSLPF